MSENDAVVENETTEILAESQEVQNAEIQTDNVDDTSVDSQTEDSIESTEETVQQDENAQDAEQVQAVKPKKTMDERRAEIQRATKEKWEVHRAIEEERKKNEDSLRKLQEEQQQQLDNSEPNIEHYEDDESYRTALRTHYQKKATLEAQTAARQTAIQTSRQQQQQQQLAKWDVERSKEIAKNPDFDLAEYRVANTFTKLVGKERAYMFSETITSDPTQGIKIINYLNKNPQEIERLAYLPPMSAIKEVGKIEAKLSRKPTKTVSNTPAPVNHESGGVTVSKDLNNTSQEDYDAIMNKKEYGY